jgi:predicted dehydrogenase
MPKASERRRYRGAILGAGSVSRRAHLPAFLEDPRVRERIKIVGMVDGVGDVPPIDGLPVVQSRDQLSVLGPIDFVDICTPTASHLELMVWALERRYHVLCEKPVALSRAEAELLAAAAAKAGRVLMPCHQYRFNPAWSQVREWLCAERIGRWHLAEVQVHRAAADGGADGRGVPWRGLLRESLGGVLLDHGTHLVYQLLDVAGTPSAVAAWTGRLVHKDYDVEDTAHLLLEFPDRVASILLTWAYRHRENRMRFVGSAGVIEWSGTELKLDTDQASERLDVTAQLDKSAYPGWFARLFLEFATALDRGEAPRAIQDIKTVAAVLEAAYTAARSGHKVAVPQVP